MDLDATHQPPDSNHACKRTHGTVVEDLLALIPAPMLGADRGDPFLTLTNRAAKTWLALFWHARTHGDWRPRPVDPSRPELTDGHHYTLGATWTVAGLAHATGVNRDTAGKALAELAAGGWVRRADPRNRGQFRGIDYYLCVPAHVTAADKARVAEGLKKRGVEFVGYRWRTAARVLDEREVARVHENVLMELAAEQADVAGNQQKGVELVSNKIIRMVKGEKT
jgi:hypothetical protein